MTSHVLGRSAPVAVSLPRRLFASVAATTRRLADAIVENSGPMQCSREADRLFQLSDAELAKLGLTRDRIISHAFARYLGV